jgi:Ca2+-binding EF-hand superfamily protein
MLKHQVIAEHLSAEEVADIKQMFDGMDVNKNGKLTYDEFKAGLRKLGNEMPDSDIRILMDAVNSLPNMVYSRAKISWRNWFMLLLLFCTFAG